MAASQIAFNAGILALVVGIIIVYPSVLLLVRYKKRSQKSTIYIAFANISWCITCLSASFVYLYAGTSLVLAKFVQVVMYGSIFAAMIFTYMFARKVFFNEKSKFYVVYTVLGIIAIVFLGISDSSYAVPFPDSTDYPALVLGTEYSLILVAYLIPTLIGIMWATFRGAKRISEKIYSRGFQVIGLGQVFILGAFSCDTIAGFIIDDVIGYAVFLYAQWLCGLIALICLYVGWTMPGWFKRLYGVKTDTGAPESSKDGTQPNPRPDDDWHDDTVPYS